MGTDSVWNDNCEYDSLMDKDCTCDFDGKGGTIGQLKPLMSTLMCKVGADAVVEHNAKARPLHGLPQRQRRYPALRPDLVRR